MADSVFGSPDSGEIGLPKIDSAMNKLPPIPKKGGAGGGRSQSISSVDVTFETRIEIVDRVIERSSGGHASLLTGI